jgi:hypothetical protein
MLRGFIEVLGSLLAGAPASEEKGRPQRIAALALVLALVAGGAWLSLQP